MYWHILLTEKCNSECRYCYKKSLKEFDNGLQNKFNFEFNAPCNFEANYEKLKKFVMQDKNPVIIFYGGEPLLQIEKIKEIMDLFGDSARYCMQTNAKLLDKLDSKYMNNFSRILVSIDGNKQKTDSNRGKGNYDLVIKNIEYIRKKAYKGEIVARMTISQSSGKDFFKQVKHLIELINKKLFDSIHWQLDMGFYKNDFNEIKIKKFVENYNKNLSELIDYWISEMANGKVFKLYPLLGFFESIYYNKPVEGIRCGAGFIGYAITTNGKITACPILNNITNFYCGDLNSKLNEIKKISVIEPCKSCKDLGICGGRCLYMNYAKLWPEKAQKLICSTIKHLINEIKRVLPEIKTLINKGVISEEDFDYEKYFGPEITP